MSVNWNSLKAAESGWRLGPAQRQQIFENCLHGKKKSRVQWQYVWKPAAYLAATAAMVLIVLLIWPEKNDAETVLAPGYAPPAPSVPQISVDGGDQDALEPDYVFEDYGQDVVYEADDGDARSIYRAYLGVKTAPEKLVTNAGLLTVQDDYMVYSQGGKLWIMNLKTKEKPIAVGDAAARAIEGWKDHVLLYQYNAQAEQYQTVLLDLAEQELISYDLDYYVADATRIGDTLYYTEWKYGDTEGKLLKSYSFADGSVEALCRVRTGSDPYEFYLADGRLYFLDEALMYCDLQTKETHQAIKPISFYDRIPCAYFEDRLYMKTSACFMIYDLKEQRVVFEEREEQFGSCYANQNGVVYYNVTKKEFTVIHADSTFTFDASGYESYNGYVGGGTVCTQGFALKYNDLLFFVKDPQNCSVSKMNGESAVRYEQWLTQHAFWETQGEMTLEQSAEILAKMDPKLGTPLTDEQRMALYLQACLQIDLHAPKGGNVDQWPAILNLHFVADLKLKLNRFVQDSIWKDQSYSEPFVYRFETEILMNPTASRSGTYLYYKNAEGTEQATLQYRDRVDAAELFITYDVGEIIPTAELKTFYKKVVRYYLSLEGVAFLEAPFRFYEGENFYPTT